MILFVLASALVTCALGCGTPPIEPLTSRVVNGVDATPHSWPWQNWVMTAAHCISSRLNYRVHVGKHNLVEQELGSKAILAEKIIIHERWNPTFISSGDHVQLACIPAAETLLANLYPCYITGWGRLSTGGPISDNLQQALLPVADHATCSKSDWWGVILRDTLLCAGGDGLVAGCNGDSGGPLNCKNDQGVWEVHGIASFVSGLGCNYVRKPTVFSRVSVYNEWIDQTMMNN
ncbi:hypothetical protein NHX12_028178 [Muraenolepis orangiensis]|uniref:Peptidase S1 domain-containing protein n=1 Tax=Muraenolepis orangiensis TaxID=630683 RepID=A0A9Q0IK25_9TELE|nr:hypothetical protein NHX12_028178 [Muraenolepis orangiensis]